MDIRKEILDLIDRYNKENLGKNPNFSAIHHVDETVDKIEYPYSKFTKLISDMETANRRLYSNKLILCEGNKIDILLYN